MANKKVSQLTSKPSVLTTDLFPIADPTTGQLYKTTISDLGTAIGSGVSSVNGLVGAVVLDTDDIQELVSPTNKWFTDTRARAALSASSPLTYNSGTGVFGIQVANGSQNGYLSSTDWTTFNAKQAALSGTGFVKSTGGTISYDTNTYLTTSAAASTYLALAGGTMTGALIGTSAGFTGYVGIGNTSPLYQLDVAGSGRFSGDLRIESTNPRIYLTDTDNNPDYFISNTDGTFTIYDVTNSASRLTISTSQIQPRLPIVSNSSIQGTAFYSDSFFSATTFVQATTFMDSPSYRLTGGTSPTGLYFGHTNKVVLANYTVGGGIDFETNGGNITMQLSSAGALSVTAGISGTTGLFTSTLRANSEITTYNGSNFGYWGVDSGNSYVYFGTSSTGYALSFQTGGTQRLGIASTGAATFSSSVTAGVITSSVASGTGTLKVNNSSVSKAWSFYPTTNGSQTDITLYEEGTSANVMTFRSGGNVGIGTTAPSQPLEIGGTGNILVAGGGTIFSGAGALFVRAGSGGDLILGANNTNGLMRITSSGDIQTNGNPVYAYNGSISIGGTYQTIFAAVSGGVYLVSVTTDSADGTFGLLTVVNDPDKSLGMIYGNNISLQFSGNNVQMKSTNGSTYNTTWTATRLK